MFKLDTQFSKQLPAALLERAYPLRNSAPLEAKEKIGSFLFRNSLRQQPKETLDEFCKRLQAVADLNISEPILVCGRAVMISTSHRRQAVGAIFFVLTYENQEIVCFGPTNWLPDCVKHYHKAGRKRRAVS